MSPDNNPIPQTDTSSDTAEGFFRLLYEVHLSAMRAFNRKVRHLGLTRPQWEVITALRAMNGATQTQLAERLEMGKSPLGKIIDKLEAMEFVVRRSDDDDRRINRIFLTEKFTPLLAPMRATGAEIEQFAFEGMPASERDRIYDGLKRIRENLGRHIDTQA